jgi:rhodanese-related sulfurtransferase
VDAASRLTTSELMDRMGTVDGLQIVDVRGPGEVAGGKITGAREVPLPRILDRLAELDPTAPTVVYCAGGYRSMIAASVMRAAGFRDVSDLIGGYGAWEQAGLPGAGRAGSVLTREARNSEARLELARAPVKARAWLEAVREYVRILPIVPGQPEARRELARLGR